MSRDGRSRRLRRKEAQLADREIRCASCNAINRIGSYAIDRISWCGKCRAALPEAISRKSIRRLYQFRRFYWIAAIVGVASVAFWQAPTKESTPTYVKRTERVAVNCVVVSRPRTDIHRNYNLSSPLIA